MKWQLRPKRLTAYDVYCGAWVCRCGAILISPPSLDGDAVVTVTYDFYDFQVLAGGIVGLDHLVLTGETRLPR